jgi:hypothetical protein
VIEPMNMATKVVMVQKLGTPDQIKSCINQKGQCRDGKVAGQFRLTSLRSRAYLARSAD